MTDECRDVLVAVTPSDARALLAVYRSACDAAQALREALGDVGLSVTSSVGRDGGPYVVVVGGDTHQVVVVSLPAGAVETLARLHTHAGENSPSGRKAA